MNSKIHISMAAALLVLCACGGGQGQQGQVSTFMSSAAPAGETASSASSSSSAVQGTLMELPAVSASDVIIRHGGYVLSYNTDMLIPDWVAYELTSEELDGYEERGDRMFSKDPSYKQKQAMREDYRDSGWTKGHMAPAADFRWSSSAMDETFYLTNVCPQDETLNGNDWEYLERQVRKWADKYGKVWVVTGPIVTDNKYGRIGDRGVVVPDAFFKAVLVQKNGKYCSVAFVMDNDSKRYYLRDCAMTVNELEEITGIDFFPALDDSLEDKVEGQLRPSDWGFGR